MSPLVRTDVRGHVGQLAVGPVFQAEQFRHRMSGGQYDVSFACLHVRCIPTQALGTCRQATKARKLPARAYFCFCYTVFLRAAAAVILPVLRVPEVEEVGVPWHAS